MAASNIIEILIKAKDDASDIVGGVVDSVSSKFESMSRTLLTAGAGLAVLTAPMLAGLYDATNQAVAFDEAMTNVQAIIRTTDEETAALSDTILDLGASSRYGPQLLAESYYDIVGGVADASAHMDILNASVTVAQAGNADLGASTSALISVMNSYQFAADQAALVSDVLVQTVAKGVGTMDEFAAALPQVTGLAASAGISLEDVGGQMAYLTTQGFSAGQSATFLRSMITTLQNPTADLANIIADLGYESGSSMIEAEGLAGAYDAIKDAAGGSFDGVITNQEALLGALALTNESAGEFLTNFTDGMEGIAEATEAIQMDSPAAQMDLFKSSVSALKIEIGEALIPVLNQIMGVVQPVVQMFIGWARENPELIATVAMITAGLGGLSTVMVVAGGVLGALAPMIGLISAPMIVAAGAVALLGLAFQQNLFGIQDMVGGVIDTIGEVITIAQNLDALGATTGQIIAIIAEHLGVSRPIIDAVSNVLSVMSDTINSGLATGAKVIENISDAVGDFIDQNPGIVKFVQSVIGVAGALHGTVAAVTAVSAGIGGVVTLLTPIAGVLATIGGALLATIFSPITLIAAAVVALYYAFQTNFLGIQTFIVGTVLPAIEELVDWVGVQLPIAVQMASEFWNTTLLPALQIIAAFVSGVVIGAFNDLSTWLSINIPLALAAASAFWTSTLQPAMQTVGDFITNTVIPAFTDVANWLSTNIPAAIALVSGFWTSTLQPALQAVWMFIQGSVLPVFGDVAAWLSVNIPTAVTSAQTAWESTLKPALETVWTFITTSLVPALTDVVNWLSTNIPAAVTSAQTAWETTLKPALETVANFVTTTAIPAFQQVYDFLQVFLPGAITKVVTDVSTALQPAFNILSEFITVTVIPGLQSLYDFLQVFLPGAVLTIKTAWETSLQPALLVVADFITNTVIVGLQSIYDFMQVFLPAAIAVMVAVWDTVLMPVLEAGATFLAETFVLTLQSVYDFLQVFIPGAIDVLKTAWDTVLYPAIEAVGGFITDTLIPAFQNIYDFGFTHIPDALNTLSSTLGTVLEPALDSLSTLLDGLYAGFIAIRDIVQEVANGLVDLADDAASLAGKVPGWLIPGSPTPFEIGLWGIDSALTAINRKSLPSFGDEMNAAGSTLPPGAAGGELSGGRSISITINVDAATVNDTANTQQNAQNLTREIEMALGAVG